MNMCHKYEKINGDLILVVYINYPDNYEFGLDFDSMKQKVVDLSDKAKKYILNISNEISDDKALIVLNGVIVGTLLISNLNNPNILLKNESDNLKNKSEIIQELVEEQNDFKNTAKNSDKNLDSNNLKQEDIKNEEDISNTVVNEKNNVDISNKTTNNKNYNDKQTSTNKTNNSSNNINNSNTPNQKNPNTSSNTNSNQNNSNLTNSNTNTNNSTNNSNNNTSNGNTNTNNNNTNSGNTNNNNTSNNTNNNTNNNNNTPLVNLGQMVSLKLNNGNIISISLEEYIIGVVGAEMPALFNIEALKAQAVAARTYAMKKVSSSGILTATTSTQCYKTNEELKKDWGGDFSVYYNKIKNAVEATKGQVIKCNGVYIDAVYFSMSNGRTEDAQNVWGNSFSYLKSVESPYDAALDKATVYKNMSKFEVSSKLGVTVNSASDFNILSRTSGNRINIINIGGKDFTGIEVRTKLGLRSADFFVTEEGESLVFMTKGYGHGVGMSQYGANEMGKRGYSYSQILTHYYTGVSIMKM